MTTDESAYERTVRRRRWLWRLLLVVLAAATAFCAWGVVDERNFSHDVATHYEASSGVVVADDSSPSGLTVKWTDSEGQQQEYVLSRGERSDLSLHAGDRTEVRYNPQTQDAFLQDEDGPAPWIPAVLGLLSGALLTLAFTRGKRWVQSIVEMPAGAVPLRTLPGAKPAYVRVTRDTLELVLPRYFGQRAWAVPLVNVAVLRSGLAESVELEDEPYTGPVFAKPILFVYLPTGMMTSSPNAMLLFGHPVQVPQLKRIYRLPGATRDLPFSYREVARGVTIDGLGLRVADASELERVLSAAAVPLVDDADAWLAERRELVHDEEQRHALIAFDERASRWSRRSGWLSGAAFLIFLAARIFGDEESNGWFAIIMLAGATAFLAPVVIERLLRRTDPNA